MEASYNPYANFFHCGEDLTTVRVVFFIERAVRTPFLPPCYNALAFGFFGLTRLFCRRLALRSIVIYQLLLPASNCSGILGLLSSLAGPKPLEFMVVACVASCIFSCGVPVPLVLQSIPSPVSGLVFVYVWKVFPPLATGSTDVRVVTGESVEAVSYRLST